MKTYASLWSCRKVYSFTTITVAWRMEQCEGQDLQVVGKVLQHGVPQHLVEYLQHVSGHISEPDGEDGGLVAQVHI